MRAGSLFFSFLFLWALQHARAQNKHSSELYDRSGRMIMDTKGNRINYKEELHDPPFDSHSDKQQNNFITPQGGTIACNTEWSFTIMGKGIGAHSLNTLDIDHDGKTETIASAYYTGYYLYTVQYNDARHTYEQQWVSPSFYYRISCVKCVDVNNDSIYEIVVGFATGDVVIFDGLTKEVTANFRVPAPYGVYDIECEDADNDNAKELVFCDLLGIYLIDPLTHTLKSTIQKNGTYDMAIADVDGDSKKEIVLSGGDIIQYNGASFNVEWTYQSGSPAGGQIELSDIDHDSIPEVIKADASSAVHVYDADTKSEKYFITTQQDIGAMAVKDINQDGVDEIIFGDGQWGELHCYNAATQSQMWSIINNNYGFSGISVGDGDNDGNLEVLWGSGQNSNAGDTLYVYDVTTKLQEWKSKALDGPFFALRVADVDNDSTLEVIIASASSAYGRGGSIVTILDATSHDIEWQSEDTLLPHTYTKVYDLEVADLDSDSANEIIIAADDYYDGAIWILDGKTKALKRSHIFSAENLTQFYTIDVADADADGQMDIIAVNDQVRIIDPATFAVKWSFPIPYPDYHSKVMVGNVDNDANPEIVVVSNPNIYIFDGVTHQTTQITGGWIYSTFDLFDMDNDHIEEVVCGTSSGQIMICNLVTHQNQLLGQVAPSSVDGIHVTLLNSDTIPEIIYSSQNTLYFRTALNVFSHIRLPGTGVAGPTDAIQAADIDQDGKEEVFIGSSDRVYQYGGSCEDCLWFGVNVSKTNVSCLSNHDGSVKLNAVGGTTPYTYTWNTGASDSSLQSLTTGVYSYTVNEQGGCRIIDSATVQKAPQVYVTATQTNATCAAPHSGSIVAYGYNGTPPYHYSWSTGDTTAAILGLLPAAYTVFLSDASHCTSQRTFTVTMPSVQISSFIQHVQCSGESNGSVSAIVTSGMAPYTFQWSTGETGSSISDLQKGSYSLITADSRSCVRNDTFRITEPSPITVSVTTNPDDLLKSGNDGSAVAVASGGTAPYSFNWHDPLMQIDSAAILLAGGNYMLVVHDSYNCRDTVNVTIETISNEIYVFPNPSTDFIIIRVNNDEPGILSIRNAMGEDMIAPTPIRNETRITTSDFSMGIYTIDVEQDEILMRKKIVLGKKP